MFRVLPLTFKPVLQQVRLLQVAWIASLFNSFCSSVAKQVARFTVPLLSVEIVSLGSRISLPRLMLASYQSSLNTELEQLPVTKRKKWKLGVDLRITTLSLTWSSLKKNKVLLFIEWLRYFLSIRANENLMSELRMLQLPTSHFRI